MLLNGPSSFFLSFGVYSDYSHFKTPNLRGFEYSNQNSSVICWGHEHKKFFQ